ncbi:MAG: hypothetical protein Q9227_006255 [Pyrenula ochraceoflavens]
MSSPLQSSSRPVSRRSQQSQHVRAARSPSPPSPPSSPPEKNPDRFAQQGEYVNGTVNGHEKISAIDPKRFTPTLHASLVAEILSLRRDLETKTTDIGNLEDALYNVTSEKDGLSEDLVEKTKETRSLKHQLQLLEGGTLSALDDIAGERDKALASQADLRSRLEASQKKAKTTEEEINARKESWEREREVWDNERRALQRQVHVTEGRLKTVLTEIANAPTTDQELHLDIGSKDTGEEADEVRSISDLPRRRGNHKRQMSTNSTSTVDSEGRPRRVSFASSAGAPSSLAHRTDANLADELAFDEDEEDVGESQELDGSPISPSALPEERSPSVQSRSHGLKARKLLGLSTNNVDFSLIAGPETEPDEELNDRASSHSNHESDQEVLSRPKEPTYQDSGVQFTPPPSPIPDSHKIEELPGKTLENSTSRADNSANQGRKRVSRVSSLSEVRAQAKTLPSDSAPGMISVACQTTSELLETLRPYEDKEGEAAVTPSVPVQKVDVQSRETQTDENLLTSYNNATGEDHVPTIAIHPPQSSPSSPRTSVVLPPRTKSVSCQIDCVDVNYYKSLAVQTEAIRIDRRMPQTLPILGSLLPSAVIERKSRDEAQKGSNKVAPKPLREPPPVPPPKLSNDTLDDELKEIDMYPGNNDNGPLAKDSKADAKRPFRTSSLFAGFDSSNERNSSKTADTGFDEDDIFSRPTASYTLKAGKMVAKTPASMDDDYLEGLQSQVIDETPSPSDLEKENQPFAPIAEGQASSWTNGKRPAMDRPRPLKLASSSKQPNFRRAAMVSNSTAVHASRVRSPSLPSSLGGRPPFPVPTRGSSRNVRLSGSEGSQSPTRMSRGPTGRRDSSSDAQSQPLRKVRSAINVPRVEIPENLPSRSPPLWSPTSDATGGTLSPSLPPLPSDDVTWPKDQQYLRGASRHAYSPSAADSTETSFQQTTVVGAIAQTMVGEWMWKYVRRRKSFGVTDSKQDWDLGKNSEELSAHINRTGTAYLNICLRTAAVAIQSVLDVRDDNPLPKSSMTSASLGPNSFPLNRSILILTPQRALKFTATSVERHYIWLNALSFLSHSPLSVSDLSAIPPVPQEEYAPAPAVSATLRRNPIRDSVRLAKGKGRGGFTGARSFTADAIPTHRRAPALTMNTVTDADYPVRSPLEFDGEAPAVAPTVPRSRRHRSNTATSSSTRPGQFRSFTSNVPPIPPMSSARPSASNYSYSLASEAGSTVGGSGSGSGRGRESLSRQASEVSNATTGTSMASRYFESVGTVRMEAFVGNMNKMGGLGGGLNRHAVPAGLKRGPRRKDRSYWGVGPEEDIGAADPFKNF